MILNLENGLPTSLANIALCQKIALFMERRKIRHQESEEKHIVYIESMWTMTGKFGEILVEISFTYMQAWW